MNSLPPWTFEEMTSSIVIRDARGHTVCNLPLQSNKVRRRANAELIVAAVNARLADETLPRPLLGATG